MIASSATSTVTGPKLRRGSMNLQQLRELLLAEAEAQAASSSASGTTSPAEQPLHCGCSQQAAPACAACHDPPQQQQPAPPVSAVGRRSIGGADTPTPATEVMPRRRDTTDSQPSLGYTSTRQDSSSGAAPEEPGSLLRSCSLPAAQQAAWPQGVATTQLGRPSSLPAMRGRRYSGVLAAESPNPSLSRCSSLLPRTPLQPYSPRLRASLQRHCAWAVSYLQLLQRPRLRHVLGGAVAPMLPKTALRFAKGLAFMWQAKAGLCAGYSWGKGFVVARLPGGGWSAPSFLSCGHLSFGLTAGFQSVKYCSVIPTQAGLAPFMDDAPSSGFDIISTLDSDPFGDIVHIRTVGAARVVGTRPGDEDASQPRSFYITEGAMVNISFKCGLSYVDEGTNAALYGQGVTPEQILGGQVERPQEFRPLYQLIEELSAAAPVVKRTQSKFLAFKQQVEQQAQRQQAQQHTPRPRLLEKARSFAGSVASGKGGPGSLKGGAAGLAGPGSSQDTLQSLGGASLAKSSAPLAGPFTSLFPEVSESEFYWDPDQPTIQGGSSLGGSPLGVSPMGGSLMGGSQPGGSLLGGLMLAGSPLGGSPHEGSVLGASLLGASPSVQPAVLVARDVEVTAGASSGEDPGGEAGGAAGQPQQGGQQGQQQQQQHLPQGQQQQQQQQQEEEEEAQGQEWQHGTTVVVNVAGMDR